jgi:hypothetical protein
MRRTTRLLILTIIATVPLTGCVYQTCEGSETTSPQQNAFHEFAGNEFNAWQMSGRVDVPVASQDK